MQPVPYRYLAGEEREKFHQEIGQLLGEEFSSDGHAATAKLETLLIVHEAGPVRHWLNNIRRQLAAMRDAAAFIKANPKREVEDQTAEAATRLGEAQAAFSKAEARKSEAENRQRQIKEAETTLASQDPVLLAAWETFTRSTKAAGRRSASKAGGE